MEKTYGYFQLAARALLASIFLYSAYGKITGFAGTAGFMATYGMPVSEWFLVATIALEIVAGVGLLIGWQARYSAVALALFMVPVTLIFHNAFVDAAQMTHFMKNVAIVGGLLMVAGSGAGAFSVDNGATKERGTLTEVAEAA